MEPAAFDQFARTLETKGVPSAIDQLVASLTEAKDYHRVFDALLLRTRHELGLPLIQRDGASELPAEVRDKYEEKVIDACRVVGKLFLDSGDVANGFQYLNMVGETEPVRQAIERYTPGSEDERIDQVIEVSVMQGVHPRKGLSLLLERNGMCQSITATEGLLAQQGGKLADRHDCIRLLVRSMHSELLGRLVAEVESKEGARPPAANIVMLIKDRAWLFDDDNYHIDTSHLTSVIRMARLLPKCEETFLALQLCEYGARLSSRYRFEEQPPFENVYADSLAYLKVVAGLEVDKGLEHFKRKADALDPEEVGTMPGEVYVQLLTIAGRAPEAVKFAARYFTKDWMRPSFCPTINDLCQRSSQFEEMASLARRRNDPISFAAGLIQQKTAAKTGT